MPKLGLAVAVIATCGGGEMTPYLSGVCGEMSPGSTVADVQLATDVRVPVIAAVVVDEQDRLDDYLAVTMLDARLGTFSVTARELGSGYLKIAYKPYERDVHWLWFPIRVTSSPMITSYCNVAALDETDAE